MIKAYSASNLQDACILVGLLHSEGIEARIFNASASGAVGEIPFTQAYPEIWVVHHSDLVRVQELLRVFEAPAASGCDLQCEHCGESSPAEFSVCWKCGGDLPLRAGD